MIKVLFVCTGNICRSPTAHAIARNKAKYLGLSDRITFDSAGIANYHIGEIPDERSIEIGEENNISFAGIFARQIKEQDLEIHDFIMAMDRYHLSEILKICPEKYKHKIHLFLEFCAIENDWDNEVIDPYYGNKKDFEDVFQIINLATDNLLKKLFPLIKHK